MGDYSNPFDDETGDPFKESGAGAAIAPPARPSSRPVTGTFGRQSKLMDSPSYSRPAMTEEQLRQWQLELERREQQLEYKERKLDEVKTEYTKAKKPPNFPRFYPIWYHNIGEEIPPQGRNLVKRMFFAWILTVTCYCMNFVAELARIIGLSSGGSSGVDFGLSIAYLLIGPFLTFVFWYRPFYYGVRKNRSISFFIFFFNFSCHIGFCIVMAIGIPNTGGAGFIVAFATLGPSAGAGVICLISAGFWALTSTFCVFQILTALRYYRNPPKLDQPPEPILSQQQAAMVVGAVAAASNA